MLEFMLIVCGWLFLYFVAGVAVLAWCRWFNRLILEEGIDKEDVLVVLTWPFVAVAVFALMVILTTLRTVLMLSRLMTAAFKLHKKAAAE